MPTLYTADDAASFYGGKKRVCQHRISRCEELPKRALWRQKSHPPFQKPQNSSNRLSVDVGFDTSVMQRLCVYLWSELVVVGSIPARECKVCYTNSEFPRSVTPWTLEDLSE